MSAYRREDIRGLVLVGRMLAREGKRDGLLQLLDEGVALCAEHEPDGALSVVFHISAASPDMVIVYEHHTGRAALEEHRANYQRIPAYGDWRARLDELLAAPIEIGEAVRPVVRFTRETSTTGQ